MHGIGIFGGTFDPVHCGHLRAALDVQQALALGDFRLLPAGMPPHRAPASANAEQRLEMLRLAVADCPELAVDDRELIRPGPSYMVDTLEEIRREAVDTPIVLVIGQDAANQLDQWHRWQELFELAHIAVMQRPGATESGSDQLRSFLISRLADEAASLVEQPCGRVYPLEVTQLAISSTGIRRMLQEGRSPRFLLPDPVLDYIERHGLYFAEQTGKG